MKKLWLVSLLAIILLLVACGEEELSGTEVVDEVLPIDVELIVPEKAELEETVLFTSVVTQGDDLVEDATEVVYEIWLEGQREQSELIEASQQEGHLYSLEYTFTKAGYYHVQTHVTARGLHRMPTSEIQVGEADVDVHSHDNEETHAHQHKHSDVTIDKTIEEERLVLFIEVDESPFREGRVTLEMSNAVDKEVIWVDMHEVEEGKYELLDIADYSGSYNAIVHITDDSIHEHVTIELSFK